MELRGYGLLWLFFVYSFLGWMIETVVAAGKQKRFVNRGFYSGPMCFVYGVSAVLMTVVLPELYGNIILQFLGCTVLATTVEWFTGKLLERITGKRWWDYSAIRWNFDGYICLPYSILWGILGVCRKADRLGIERSDGSGFPYVYGSGTLWSKHPFQRETVSEPAQCLDLSGGNLDSGPCGRPYGKGPPNHRRHGHSNGNPCAVCPGLQFDEAVLVVFDWCAAGRPYRNHFLQSDCGGMDEPQQPCVGTL